MLFQIVGLYSEAKCKTKVNKVKYSLYFLDLNRNKMSFKKFNFGSDSNTFFFLIWLQLSQQGAHTAWVMCLMVAQQWRQKSQMNLRWTTIKLHPLLHPSTVAPSMWQPPSPALI